METGWKTTVKDGDRLQQATSRGLEISGQSRDVFGVMGLTSGLDETRLKGRINVL